jgi:hypothetical protein
MGVAAARWMVGHRPRDGVVIPTEGTDSRSERDALCGFST